MSLTNTNNNVMPEWAAFVKDELSGKNRLREGDVVNAVLIKKASRAVFFDLGKFGTGIVYGLELSSAKEILKGIRPGDSAPAKIEKMEDEDGYVEISLSEASRQKLWQEVKALQENGEVVKVKILGANPSGLIADLIGLKAFLPFSQLSFQHYPQGTEGDREKNLEEMKKLTGQELNVKVLVVNPRNRKLIVSERETLVASAKELAGQYQVGQVVDGIVSSIADFGVFIRFVDNPQVEGLAHISELGHKIVESPKEVVSLNETVKAKIIEIKDGRILLSLKALLIDPWLDAGERFKIGQELTGRINKLNPFGAVVDLENGLQGMVHVSEFGGVEEMKSALTPGNSYDFVVALVKPEDKRIILKLKK